jgi:GntR family transcriptional regulator
VVDYDNIVELRPLKGEACLELARLRLADEQPVCHQISIVLTARCPGIEKADFARQSLYDILANEYQLVITRIEHRVRAVAADEFRARLLGTADGSPLLYVAATAYAGDGAVIEHSTSYYRTDNYEFRTTQVNATGG